MSLHLPWSSNIHALLDLRAEGATVEFVTTVRTGEVRSLARASLPGTEAAGGILSAVRIVTAAKELRTQYPQFSPQSVIVFLHTPHTTRVSTTVSETFTQQVITQQRITKLLEGIPKPADEGQVLVHQYVASYRVNGYRVRNPLKKEATELVCTVAQTFVSKELYETVLAPLEAAFGVPLRAANFAEVLANVVLEDSGLPNDFRVCDVAYDATEVSYVQKSAYDRAVAVPVGVHMLLESVRATSEMSLEEIQTSLPLLKVGTLEETLAKRLAQGVSVAADLLSTKIDATDTVSKRVLPMLVVFPPEQVALGELILKHLRFAVAVPHGDMPSMARVVGL